MKKILEVGQKIKTQLVTGRIVEINYERGTCLVQREDLIKVAWRLSKVVEAYNEARIQKLAGKIGLRAARFTIEYEKAEDDDAQSQHFVAESYWQGVGVGENQQEALHWYRKAAKNGHIESQRKLGKYYDPNHGMEPAAQKAVYWSQKAVQQGMDEAQYNLALCYQSGIGLKQDDKKAFLWMEQSAEQGNIEAAYCLAGYYENGQGTDKNLGKAFRWYEMAAYEEHRGACYMLAHMYEHGIGSNIDIEEAIDWYQIAAEKGHKEAREKVDDLNKILSAASYIKDFYERKMLMQKKRFGTNIMVLKSKANKQINDLREEYDEAKIEFSDANERLEEKQSELSGLEDNLQEAQDTLGKKEKRIKQLEREVKQKGSDLFFDNPVISGWLLSDVSPASLGLPKKIGTVGSGPHKESDFDELIKTSGFTGMMPGESNKIVVVGRDEVEIDDFVENLGLERGNKPKIYSQEMFMLLLMTGKDPFDAPPEVLYEFAEGHPVLEALMENEFEWPAIHERESSDEGVIVIDGQLWHSQSPLTAMGYHVGKTGLNAAQRRRILKKIMEHRLQFPRGFSASDKSEWGQAATSTRLEKIANHIAFNVSFRSTQSRYRYAVKDWKSDLAWLKKTYYHKMKRRFSWPG